MARSFGVPFGGSEEEGKLSLTYPEVPEFVPPALDIGRVQELTQQTAAPGLRRERFGTIRGLQLARAEGERRGNPLSQLLRRQVLEARGQNIADIMSGAQQQARSLYGPEYAAAVEAERSRVESARQKATAEYAYSIRRDLLDRSRGPSGRSSTGGRTITRRAPLRFSGSTSFGGGVTAATRRQGGGGFTAPQVNPSYWPGGYAQQQEALRLSADTNIPLEQFYGRQDPNRVVQQVQQQGADKQLGSEFL